ncbi:KTSC domain-containing protein [Pseudalkalibacillus berkeleyi]|uniref:KTSC domain-containing protein n=1 Tax=Pseudalkalibacillus berkeleyi TaxID=1069813 RepID=A0ABS9H2H6_9BACL|nr:KTSC domain-containing protein [Pseudalkalibacillus berkeleyi]MCF6138035.1 KTSC domain-containing protein [Pseudalkalibacillus berkeleyi]
MQFTTFHSEEWNLKTFHTIGYQKDSETLHVCLHGGSTLEVLGVTEQRLFEFILAPYKEQYLQNQLLPNHEVKVVQSKS